MLVKRGRFCKTNRAVPISAIRPRPGWAHAALPPERRAVPRPQPARTFETPRPGQLAPGCSRAATGNRPRSVLGAVRGCARPGLSTALTLEPNFISNLTSNTPMRYMLSLDAGTTSVRAVVFDPGGQIRAVAQKEIRQIFPKPGWVEQD